jgi:hypothetical protein
MFVASPAGHPDTVWIGGSMAYGELFGPSNGRAVQRSTDAGVDFTDMTNDAAGNGMHPDQHALAFDPANPDIAFVGSDGGVVRTSGSFANSSSACSSRGLTGANLADCQAWLSAIPTRNFDLNAGLSTLQFQSVTINQQNPSNDVIGGTQDNGTWAYTGPANKWFETVGGDGGQSIIDVGNPNIRVHTYFGPQADVNFQGTNPVTWDWIGDPLVNSGEAASFYIPLVGDSVTSQSMYAGLQHVWRTTDSGGSQSYLDSNCNELTGTFISGSICGDWAPLGTHTLTGSAYGTDKGGSYVVAITRANDASTMWVGTRIGRLFITTNANAANPSSVSFTRIDSSSTPTRFISSIQVDPANPYHAFVSFSGYNAYATAAGTATGHVFDVTYNPGTGTATWKDISYDMGDVPVTSVAFDNVTGDLYASSDFGVAVLRAGTTTWVPAAPGLPNVTVYGLAISPSARLLYAATHGRSIWVVKLG